MDTYDVVIVGAGHAGAQAAASLRQEGFQGTIAMIGDEPDLPYERPPLSKAYLAGSISADKLTLRPQAYWEEKRIKVVVNERVTTVDAAGRSVQCASGSRYGYGHLVWAAGGSARSLSCDGAEMRGIHVVRTRRQVDALKDEAESASNIVIVGGGYIGLETAAALVKAGKTVTVLEAQERVLARVTSPVVSDFFSSLHRGYGVVLHTSANVVALEGRNGRVQSVRLNSGVELDADLVIVGVGLEPEVAALVAAGAACTNGVDVDDACRTSLPDVYAIGDCANHQNHFADNRRIRLESVQNANDQAKVAAANIAGVPTKYLAVPWFWSNQYDVRLQTVGLSIGYDDAVVRGFPEDGHFSVVYLRGDTVIAVDCINKPRDFTQGKKLVGRSISVERAVLADPIVDLAGIAARAIDV